MVYMRRKYKLNCCIIRHPGSWTEYMDESGRAYYVKEMFTSFYMDLSPYIFFCGEMNQLQKLGSKLILFGTKPFACPTSRRVALAPGSIQWTKCTGNSLESSEKHLPHPRHRPKREKSDLPKIADRQAGNRMCEDV